VALHPPCWRPSLLLPPRQESPFRAALDAAPCAFDHHVHVSVLGSSPSCSIIGRTPCRLHHLLCQIIISSIISILAEPSRCISGHASCRPSFVISFSNRHAISSIALHAVQLDLHLLVSSHHHIVSFASLDSSLTHEVVHPRPDRRPVSHHVALVRVRPARSPARCRSHVLLLKLLLHDLVAACWAPCWAHLLADRDRRSYHEQGRRWRCRCRDRLARRPSITCESVEVSLALGRMLSFLLSLARSLGPIQTSNKPQTLFLFPAQRWGSSHARFQVMVGSLSTDFSTLPG
jgi:hypothetical protein